MPKNNINQDIEQIFALVARHADGVDLTTLMQDLNGCFSRRTLQRRLADLVAGGRLIKTGAGRALKYRLALLAEAHLTLPPLKVEATAEVYVPLSPESLAIKAYVRQPRQNRQPVGYRIEFLEAYHPNQTFYLPESLRAQLHDLGRSPLDDAPAGTFARDILDRLLIDLSWASSRLEGNTYSRLDTERLIEFGQAASDKDARETQMILNHKAAIELLVENVDSAEFNRYLLMNLHGVLAENLLPNPADEGRIRQHAVDIGQSVYRPLTTPQQIEDALDTLLAKANGIVDPFEQSFFMMVHLPYLQPFADINKRSSRLAANLPLFRANLCPLTFLDVPEQAYSRATLGVYEMTRVELLRDLYVWAYERSTQEYLAIKQDLAEPDPLRLAWRDFIKASLREVVTHPELDPLDTIRQAVARQVPAHAQPEVQALIIEELRRLHEGVLARYGLRPSEFAAWKAAHRQ